MSEPTILQIKVRFVSQGFTELRLHIEENYSCNIIFALKYDVLPTGIY